MAMALLKKVVTGLVELSRRVGTYGTKIVCRLVNRAGRTRIVNGFG